LFVERTRDVADHACKTTGCIDERSHPAFERFVVELLRQVRRAPVVVFQLRQTFAELALRFCVKTADFIECGERAGIERGR
jgi:hypothetical protein